MSILSGRRRSRHGGRCTAIVLVAALAATGLGCSGDDEAAPQSALVESMWAQDDPIVSATRPDVLHLPGPELPEGVVLSDVARPDDPPPPERTPDPLEPTEAAQTLYAEPTAAVPEGGPTLVVGRTQASDVDGELILVEGDLNAPARSPGPTPGRASPVEVGRDGAERVEVGDLLVIRWPLPVECACDQDAFVVARGVDPEVVLAAARTADVEADRPSIPETERDGLRSLGTVAGSFRDLPPWSAFPERLTVRHDGAEAEIELHRGDPRMVAHARFWAPAGRLVSTFPARRRTVVLDDGTIAHATAFGDDVAPMEPIIDQVLASLVPASDAEVTAAQAAALTSVPLPPCLAVPSAPGEPDQTDLRGTAGEARWVVGVAVRDDSLWTCDAVAPVGVPALAGDGAGSWPSGSDPASPVEVVSVVTSGAPDGSKYRVIIGHVPSEVAEVALVLGDAEETIGSVAEEGPASERRWFAVVTDVTPFGLRTPSATVITRRADGSEVSRTPLLDGP